jgi:hypothetical protein
VAFPGPVVDGRGRWFIDPMLPIVRGLRYGIGATSLSRCAAFLIARDDLCRSVSGDPAAKGWARVVLQAELDGLCSRTVEDLSDEGPTPKFAVRPRADEAVRTRGCRPDMAFIHGSQDDDNFVDRQSCPAHRFERCAADAGFAR